MQHLNKLNNDFLKKGNTLNLFDQRAEQKMEAWEIKREIFGIKKKEKSPILFGDMIACNLGNIQIRGGMVNNVIEGFRGEVKRQFTPIMFPSKLPSVKFKFPSNNQFINHHIHADFGNIQINNMQFNHIKEAVIGSFKPITSLNERMRRRNKRIEEIEERERKNKEEQRINEIQRRRGLRFNRTSDEIPEQDIRQIMFLFQDDMLGDHLELLGEGCFGKVYLYRGLDGKEYAVKEFKNGSHGNVDEDYIILEKMQGIDGIPKLYGYVKKNLMITERINGVMMINYEEGRTEGFEVNPDIVDRMKDTLQQILNRGIMPSDLHGGNIMIDDRGLAVIVDVGHHKELHKEIIEKRRKAGKMEIDGIGECESAVKRCERVLSNSLKRSERVLNNDRERKVGMLAI